MVKWIATSFLLGLSSCGFKPVLGPAPMADPEADTFLNRLDGKKPPNTPDECCGKSVVTAANQVHVKGIGYISAIILHTFRQDLRVALKHLFIPNNYQFNVCLTFISGEIGFGLDASSVRSQQQLVARVYQLVNGKPVIFDATGKDYFVIDSVSSYTQTSNDALSNISAQESANKRLISDLALQVRSLIASFVRKK